MHLVQLLLPVYDAAGKAFSQALHAEVARELTERFGGVTAYTRAPAVGLWEGREGQTQRDDIAVVEVMVEELDRAWWSGYRRQLERRFAQEELVVRAQEIVRL